MASNARAVPTAPGVRTHDILGGNTKSRWHDVSEFESLPSEAPRSNTSTSTTRVAGSATRAF